MTTEVLENKDTEIRDLKTDNIILKEQIEQVKHSKVRLATKLTDRETSHIEEVENLKNDNLSLNKQIEDLMHDKARLEAKITNLEQEVECLEDNILKEQENLYNKLTNALESECINQIEVEDMIAKLKYSEKPRHRTAGNMLGAIIEILDEYD